MLEHPRWHLLSEACGKSHLNIFFAGSGFTYDLIYDVGVRCRLLSWHANTQDDIEQYVKSQACGRESFGICDSGAFTVWNKGESIDVREYAKNLLKFLQHFDIAANLDVIPGRKGMPARDITPAITDKAASDGWNNFIILTDFVKANGFDTKRIMPIFHQGESFDWLKKMVDFGCDYIGISPSNDYQTAQRQLWLDDVYDYLLKLPKLPRTHGYAVTSQVLMGQFPWFSVDSASWVQQGGYGGVMTPFGNVTLSDRPGVIGKAEAIEGRNWSPEMKKKLNTYFQEHGLDIELMKKSFQERWKANAIYMLLVEKQMNYKPRMRSAGLFDTLPSIKNEPKETQLQDCFGMTLTDKHHLGDLPMTLNRV